MSSGDHYSLFPSVQNRPPSSDTDPVPVRSAACKSRGRRITEYHWSKKVFDSQVSHLLLANSLLSALLCNDDRCWNQGPLRTTEVNVRNLIRIPLLQLHPESLHILLAFSWHSFGSFWDSKETILFGRTLNPNQWKRMMFSSIKLILEMIALFAV